MECVTFARLPETALYFLQIKIVPFFTLAFSFAIRRRKQMFLLSFMVFFFSEHGYNSYLPAPLMVNVAVNEKITPTTLRRIVIIMKEMVRYSFYFTLDVFSFYLICNLCISLKTELKFISLKDLY